MYLQIGTETYRQLRNVSFSPEINVAGTALPVPEFSVDIVTEDPINVGDYATMVGHNALHFAKYWILRADRVEPGVVRIRAQSRLTILDRHRVPATMYSHESATDVLDDLFEYLDIDEYALPLSLASVEITGFCPEETARERLLRICFVCGAYVSTFGDKGTGTEHRDFIMVKQISETATLVPLNCTFLRPTVTYQDYVTAVTATAFSFTERSPEAGEESVTDGTHTWVVSRQAHSLANPDAPEAVPDNVVNVPEVMLINSSNIDEILSRLAKYYFPRVSIELDAINNGEWFPGQKLQVYTSRHTIASGYAERMDFRFGIQSRSTIHLTACAEVDGATLLIKYLYQGAELARREYMLPVGYEYSIQNPYPDVTAGKLRTIFRPENEAAEGTVAQGGTVDEEPCQQALILDNSTGVLRIISVDEWSVEEKTVDGETVLVGVIA